MSTRFTFIPLFVCCGLATMFLEAAPVQAKTGSQTVATARRNYEAIERNIKRFQRLETDLFDYSTEGGTLVAYFENGAARKLVAQYYWETGHAVEEYYFSGGRLFFVLRTEMHYDKPSEIYGKAARKAQNRSYFADGKLVRWIGGNGKARAAGQEFAAHERQTLAQARRLLSKANALLN
jgi:hypothetical protein